MIVDTISGVIYNCVKQRKGAVMTKWQKLLQRLYALDTGLRYDELAKILKEHGYSANETGSGSSHITFRKKGCQPITVPRHNPIKKAYIEIISNAIKKEENNS